MMLSYARISKRLAILLIVVLLTFFVVLQVTDYRYWQDALSVFLALQQLTAYRDGQPSSVLAKYPPGDYRRFAISKLFGKSEHDTFDTFGLYPPAGPFRATS